jgi:hypothetical protein
MKTSSTWNFKSIVGKIMMGLVLASMIGSIDVVPALAKDNSTEKHDKGSNQQKGHVNRYSYGGAFYFPKPPPIIYVPPPPRGIDIFFPRYYFNSYNGFNDFI